MPLRWGNALYILNDIISEMFKFSRTMNIKEHYYFNRGPGLRPGKFLKIYACSNFFWPPLLGSLKLFWPPFFGVWNFFDPSFLELQNFFDPLLIFQPPTKVFMNAPLDRSNEISMIITDHSTVHWVRRPKSSIEIQISTEIASRGKLNYCSTIHIPNMYT